MQDFTYISSPDNSLIKLVCALQSSSKARRENALFVLEGLRICEDAYDNGIQFNKLIVTENAAQKYAAEIEKFASSCDNCYMLPEKLFKKISDTVSPQGIIAVAKLPEVMRKSIDLKGRYIALENLQDPSNLGAVARTAEALGVSGIILSSNSCDPFSPKSLRASMGTLLRLPVIVFEDFARNIKNSGLMIYSCVVDKEAKNIAETAFNDGTVLVIGNEANGITDEVKAVSNELITIKMSGKAESLNAAVAAAISMWEMMKK